MERSEKSLKRISEGQKPENREFLCSNQNDGVQAKHHSFGVKQNIKKTAPLVAAAFAVMAANGADAAELAPLPAAGTSDNTQTSNLAPVPSTIEGSAYTMTKIQEGGEKPAGEDIVTRFTYNAETKTMMPVYYRMELNKTAYGEGDTTKYYGWTTDEQGNKTFGEVSQSDADITFNYNTPASSLDRVFIQGKHEDIIGDFTGQTYGSGGAIQVYNADIDRIEGNFINNSATYKGGAILQTTVNTGSHIGSIIGNFIDNNVINNDSDASGGAIYTIQDIDSIKGDFAGNYVQANQSAMGGAIANVYSTYYGTIGSIEGDFIGNHVVSENFVASGGAIANASSSSSFTPKIGSINGDFIGNYAKAHGDTNGGAIYNNSGNIGSIAGDFIGNYAQSSKRSAFGGAIYNSREISNITGDFIGNYAKGSTSASGGAINNAGGTIGGTSVPSDHLLVISVITMENKDTNETVTAYILQGGDEPIPLSGLSDMLKNGYKIYPESMYQKSEVDSAEWEQQMTILDQMLDQGVISLTDPAAGLSEDNFATFSGITGDFIGNHAVSETDFASGGAIYNTGIGTMYDINGDFIGNYAKGTTANGGAINNTGTMKNINGDFIGNYAEADGATKGGAIYVQRDGIAINNIKGDFIDNHAESVSGSAYGGAIANVKAYRQYYGAVDTIIDNVSGTFANNYVSAAEDAKGGAIYTEGKINNIENSSFINNYAVSKNGEAKGGAIYAENDLNITANKGYTSVFSGNYVESNGVKENNAIYMGLVPEIESGNKIQNEILRPGKLTLSASEGASIVVNDKIVGENGTLSSKANMNLDGNVDEKTRSIVESVNDTPYKLNLTGDSTGTIQLNNDVDAVNMDGTEGSVDIDLSEVNLHLAARDNVIDNNNLTMNSGSFNMINNQVGTAALNSLTVNGNTNMMADVDLANQTMDRITADSYGEHKGNINVVGMNLLSDAPQGQDKTDIYFAQIGLKDNVTLGSGDLPNGYQTTAYTPIYKYHVMYDNRDDGGYFTFQRGAGSSGNPSDAYNPSILSSPVAAQAGAYAAQNAAFTYAFTHADTFMPLPSVERFALRHENQYAALSYDNLATQMSDLHHKGMWVRPYTSFESIPLDNGPDVDTITYGTLIGGDSDFKELKHGWGTVFTGYVGYNGSSQSYPGVNTYQNGGLLGATQTFYKGNFFTALTASVGASAGESHNMYGIDNFAMLMAGVASKSGYNLEFKDGRFIVQPSLMLSYSFINTFDYKTASGVNMESDPMHAIQINPNVKFIANLKNGWQPYASVGMVWNLLDGTNVRANTVRLPEMSIKPYVEYGVGLQKRWKDKFTGYAQAMIRNGGRNGVALTAGFRWALGKDGKSIEKVDAGKITKIKKAPVFKLSSMGAGVNSQPDTDKEILRSAQNDRTVTTAASGKKIIKQLSQAQKTALGARPQNTTRTTNNGVLKQL